MRGFGAAGPWGSGRAVTQAVRETLRLWPVVANGPFRETTAPARVRGKMVANAWTTTARGPSAPPSSPNHQTCPLPAPTAFQVPHWTLHRHPALWPQPKGEGIAPPDAFDIDRPASKNATRFVLHAQGGGWCWNEDECAERAKGVLGSSKGWGNTTRCYGECAFATSQP